MQDPGLQSMASESDTTERLNSKYGPIESIVSNLHSVLYP